MFSAHVWRGLFPRAVGAALLAATAAVSFGPCRAADARTAKNEVTVVNRSRVTACAEEDNVDFELARRNIAGFTLKVAYPAYIGTIATEKLKPDFRGCAFDFTRRPVSAKWVLPQEITLYKSAEIRLVGVEIPHFWRPNQVPLVIGKERAFAPLVQVWVTAAGRSEQVIAFYPPDGYWRFRPLPYGRQRFSSYGSSVLIGPVERGPARPYVAIKQVVFDPQARSFRLDFAAGGSASIKLGRIDDRECTIMVAFSGALPNDRAFAALRSMFVDERHADVARIAWTKDRPAELISAFREQRVSRLWMGRSIESLHNNTAPDHFFSDFVVSE